MGTSEQAQEVNAPAAKPGDLSSMLRIHLVEGRTCLLTLCTCHGAGAHALSTCHGMHTCTCVYTHKQRGEGFENHTSEGLLSLVLPWLNLTKTQLANVCC